MAANTTTLREELLEIVQTLPEDELARLAPQLREAAARAASRKLRRTGWRRLRSRAGHEAEGRTDWKRATGEFSRERVDDLRDKF